MFLFLSETAEKHVVYNAAAASLCDAEYVGNEKSPSLYFSGCFLLEKSKASTLYICRQRSERLKPVSAPLFTGNSLSSAR